MPSRKSLPCSHLWLVVVLQMSRPIVLFVSFSQLSVSLFHSRLVNRVHALSRLLFDSRMRWFLTFAHSYALRRPHIRIGFSPTLAAVLAPFFSAQTTRLLTTESSTLSRVVSRSLPSLSSHIAFSLVLSFTAGKHTHSDLISSLVCLQNVCVVCILLHAHMAP